jgi:putative ABC transport system permease protein
MILGEAAVIGVVGGALGVGAGALLAWLFDAAIKARYPDIPFAPEAYVQFHWLILGAGLASAVLFAVLGGFLPARRAARMEPAQALAAN